MAREGVLFSSAPHTCLTAIQRKEENLRQAWKWVVEFRRTDTLARALSPLVRYRELTGTLAFSAQVFLEAAQELDPGSMVAEGN